jgi:hypothetical protein
MPLYASGRRTFDEVLAKNTSGGDDPAVVANVSSLSGFVPSPFMSREHRRRACPDPMAEPEVTGSAVCIQLKPVSNARFGDQVAGVSGIGLQFAAQIGQVHPQVIRFGLVARPPHLLKELLLRYQPVDVAYQDFQ